MNQVSTQNVLTPTPADFQQLLAMNPLAASQLEAIVWKRACGAEAEARQTLELEIAEATEVAEAVEAGPPLDMTKDGKARP